MSNRLPRFKALIRPAVAAGGELWFPSRLDQEYLDSQKERLGPYLFSTQYLLNPIPSEDRRFEHGWIKYQDFYLTSAEGRVALVLDGRTVPVNVSTTVDPAISDKKWADYTGIVTVACDPQDKWYVLEARRVRGGAETIIKEIVREIRTWHVGVVGIETVAFQMALKEFLMDRLHQEGLLTALQELKSGSGRSKRARIEGLVPKFSNDAVVLRKGLDPFLEVEMLQWPKAQYDDLIDSLSHQLDLAIPADIRGQRISAVEWFDLSPEERQRRKKNETSLVQSGHRPSAGY